MKRLITGITAAVILTASALPAYAETNADTAADYSIGALSAPKITKAVKTTNSVTLKWTKVKGATGYKVYKKVGNRYKVCGTVRGGSKVKFKAKGLLCAKKYSFKVRAFRKKSGRTSWSRYSAAKSVTTKADYSIYNTLLDDVMNYSDIYDSSITWYYLEDIDGNGIKELFAPCGFQYGICTYEVYTQSNGTFINVGYVTKDLRKKGNTYYGLWARQGMYTVTKITLSNYKLNEQTVEDGTTDPDDPDYPFDKYGKACRSYDFYDRSPLF